MVKAFSAARRQGKTAGWSGEFEILNRLYDVKDIEYRAVTRTINDGFTITAGGHKTPVQHNLELLPHMIAQPQYQITVDNQVVRTLTNVRDAIKLYNETAA